MKEVRKLSQIILISVLCFVFSSVSLSCITIVRLEADPADLSIISAGTQLSDQDRLTAALGYPDEFIVIFDEGQDNIRVEMWLYSDLERYFTFEGGQYTGGDTVVTATLAPDNLKVNPADFVFGMSRQNIDKLTGDRGTAIIDEAAGYSSVIYKQGQISCTFNGKDQLVTVLKTRLVSGSKE